MKILLMTPAIVGINPGLTGGEMRFIEIMRGWLDAGHEVHMYTSLGGKNLCESLGIQGVTYHIISESARENRWAFILRTLKILFSRAKELEKIKFDIVYSPSEQMYDVIPAWRLKRRWGSQLKWATVVHWLPPFPPWKRQSSNIINSTLFFISERIGVNLARKSGDVLLPVSTSTLKQLQDVFGENPKFQPVDCGVDLKQIDGIVQKVTTKQYDAVFMKRLQAVKGIFDLIKIWEKVVAHKPDAKLAIIGSGIDGEKARQIVKEMGLDKNIEFKGVIYDMKEKFSIIAQSKLFVLPTYEENWAIVIGEAMAAGVPVISYGLAELVEVWKTHFVPIPVGDIDAFAQAIIDHLDNPEKCHTLSKSALAFMERYDWSRIATSELEIIKKS